jgi:hypothetical protein
VYGTEEAPGAAAAGGAGAAGRAGADPFRPSKDPVELPVGFKKSPVGKQAESLGRAPLSCATSFGRRGLRVAGQGNLALPDHVQGVPVVAFAHSR